jgi:quercetin dioxygenase-like cupin family protein
MKIQNYRQVAGVEAAPGVTMRVVAGPSEGAPTFVMRVFEINPGCATPHHVHSWEHEMFVVKGEGTLKSGNTEKPLKEGDAITVLPDERHGVFNTGKKLLTVICVVPLVDGKMPGMPAQD